METARDIHQFLDRRRKNEKISIVIPALNEEDGIGHVLQEIPLQALHDFGYETGVLIIDNGSTDSTTQIAREYGATVILQPLKGYGNAYRMVNLHESEGAWRIRRRYC